MAQWFFFQRYTETGTYENLGMWDGTNGIYIARNGWVPQIATKDENGRWQNVIETVTLQIEGTSHDDLADKVNTLEGWLRQIREDTEIAVGKTPVWIYAKLDNESYARYAHVNWVKGELRSAVFAPPVSPGSFIQEYVIVFERSPLWVSAPDYISLDYIGDSVMGTASMTLGSASALMTQFDVSIGTGGPLTELWWGFKTSLTGIDDFTPVWQCENASSFGDDTSVSGSVVEITFSTTQSMAERFVIEANDIYTSSAAAAGVTRGEFMVLARARASGTHTYRMQMLDGYNLGSAWQYHDRAAVPASGVGTDWYVYPMGTVSIPPGRFFAYGGTHWPLYAYAIRIDAERVTTSGTGNLQVDRLYLVPIAEGGAYMSGTQIGGNYIFRVVNNVGRRPEAYSFYDGNSIADMIVFQPNGEWAVPAGRGSNGIKCVAVGQRSTQHVVGDRVNISITCMPRYLTLRGDENPS